VDEPDGASHPAVNILEFRGDEVAREAIYVAEMWDAPDWRALASGAVAPGVDPRRGV
jgi:hypothetical protein